mgnify:CR=1 FL=1
MRLLQISKDSLSFPKKESVKRLMKIEMKHTILFLFLLLFILILPTEMELLLNNEGDIPKSIFFLQLFVVYPLFMIFLGLAGVSFLSGLFMFISRMVKRRLKYQFLWKMTVYALSKPILIVTLLDFLAISNPFFLVLIFLLLVFLMYKMIVSFPKRSR